MDFRTLLSLPSAYRQWRCSTDERHLGRGESDVDEPPLEQESHARANVTQVVGAVDVLGGRQPVELPILVRGNAKLLRLSSRHSMWNLDLILGAAHPHPWPAGGYGPGT